MRRVLGLMVCGPARRMHVGVGRTAGSRNRRGRDQHIRRCRLDRSGKAADVPNIIQTAMDTYKLKAVIARVTMGEVSAHRASATGTRSLRTRLLGHLLALGRWTASGNDGQHGGRRPRVPCAQHPHRYVDAHHHTVGTKRVEGFLPGAEDDLAQAQAQAQARTVAGPAGKVLSYKVLLVRRQGWGR
jgi:hypothetical protein